MDIILITVEGFLRKESIAETLADSLKLLAEKRSIVANYHRNNNAQF